MPDQSAEYWEEKAARAIEAANKMTTAELRTAYLKIAQNYKEIAAHTRVIDQWKS